MVSLPGMAYYIIMARLTSWKVVDYLSLSFPLYLFLCSNIGDPFFLFGAFLRCSFLHLNFFLTMGNLSPAFESSDAHSHI
jgi:hypothetical protein